MKTATCIIPFLLLAISLHAQNYQRGFSIQTQYGGAYFQTWPEGCEEDTWLCVPYDNETMEKVGITIGRWKERKVQGIEIVYYYNTNKTNTPNDVVGLELRQVWQLSYFTSHNWIETRLFKSPIEFALNGHFAPGFYYYRGIESNSDPSTPPFEKIRWYTAGIDIGIELRLGFRAGSSKVMIYFEPLNPSLTTRTFGLDINGGFAIRF